MKRLLAAAVAGIFFLTSPGPGQAQKEVQPPPMSPLLEGQRPLEVPESKEPTPPPKASTSKKEEKATKGKSAKNPSKATTKQQAAKKKQASANKKKSSNTSKKKRPVETPPAGPEEG